MKPTIAMFAAAIFVAAYSIIVQADPQSVEATEHAAKAEYKAAKKQAKADYKAAKEKCRSMKGNEKDMCLKQAKADYTAAVEDAKAGKKTKQAQAEATEHKMEAEYKFAKEKCDGMSGDANSACLAQAKAQYKR
jgi:hypothetical protein